MKRNYKFHNKLGNYFISFATVYWIDVFTRQEYFCILEESLQYCRKEKGMEIFAYCIMTNHIHLIFRSVKGDPSGLLRDFKKHTSKQLLKAILGNFKESRREWILGMFKNDGRTKANISKYQFWQHHNQPVELWSTKVIKQKINYIHYNPVKAGFVDEPAQWKYSSASNYSGNNTGMPIDDIGLLG